MCIVFIMQNDIEMLLLSAYFLDKLIYVFYIAFLLLCLSLCKLFYLVVIPCIAIISLVYT